MEIDQDYRAMYATKDNLVQSQWQTIQLPRSTPVTVIYNSTSSIDIFVISDEGLSALKWLSKNFKNPHSKFWELIQEQDATMCQGDFTWFWPRSTSHQTRMGNRMMRPAERTDLNEG